MNVLIFAGTKNGRELAVLLADKGHQVYISSATQYGAAMVPKHPFIQHNISAVDVQGILSLINGYNIDVVIDATHPYAVEISKHLMLADKACAIPLIRYERKKTIPDEIGHHCSTMSAACDYIGKHNGNVLFTTGVKDLGLILRRLDKERVYSRILDTPSSRELAMKAGLSLSRTITMMPPYSVKDNLRHIKDYDIEFLVTKDSGKEGNIEEKILAADKAGIQLVVIDRPQLCFQKVLYTSEEVISYLVAI